MYIGPWQEYRLSQNQINKANNKKENDELLRQQLLRALQESLDPEAAAKAIEAVDKTLEKPRPINTERTSFPLIPPTQRRIRTYRRANDTSRTKLPSIAIYAYDSERDSIPSHRSTRSEPIQGTKMLFTPDKRPPSHHEPRRINNSLPTTNYDSNGVLDVLRLQKQEESKRNRPDFSGMWKWKDQNTQSSTVKPVVETKVNQVKKMHELYRQNVTDISTEMNDDVAQLKPTTPRKMQLSPIQHRPQQNSPYHKPQTPVVKDKDLTTDDYEIVSKYFKLHSNPQQSIRIPSPQKLPIISSPVRKLHSPDNISSPLPVSDSMRYNDSDIVDDDPQYTLTADQSLLQPNSPDGLLNWCATLNTDFIDDLY